MNANLSATRCARSLSHSLSLTLTLFPSQSCCSLCCAALLCFAYSLSLSLSLCAPALSPALSLSLPCPLPSVCAFHFHPKTLKVRRRRSLSLTHLPVLLCRRVLLLLLTHSGARTARLPVCVCVRVCVWASGFVFTTDKASVRRCATPPPSCHCPTSLTCLPSFALPPFCPAKCAMLFTPPPFALQSVLCFLGSNPAGAPQLPLLSLLLLLLLLPLLLLLLCVARIKDVQEKLKWASERKKNAGRSFHLLGGVSAPFSVVASLL